MKKRDARRRSTPRPAIDPDALSSEDLTRLEAESDVFIDLVGHVERHRPDSAAYDDPRFLAWLARESGEAEPELLGEAEVGAIARRVVAALEEERFGVRSVAGAPAQVRVAHPGPTSALVDELARSGCTPLLELGVAAGAGRALWDADCESCVPLPGDVPHGRYLALRVSGESMTPLMCSGDVVLVRLGPEVAPDSIVVAHGPDDGYVVKRVGRVTPRRLELVSLNPTFPSMEMARDEHTVLGTVVLRWCEHGT